MPSRLPAVPVHSVARALASLALVAFAGCYADDDTTAPGAPALTLETTAIDLGLRDASTGTTPSRVLTLHNGGDASTGTISVSFESSTTAGLRLTTGTTGACAGHTLAAGASCTITVSLGGQSAGPQSGVVEVADEGDASTFFTIPVQGAIRAALSVAFQGAGHGTVSAEPASAVHGCIGATNCAVSTQAAVCTATCGLAIDAATITLVATADPSSTFDGFVRAAGDSPCVPASGSSCMLSLADMNSVTARFTPK